jgi:CRP/FNR family transcriptional regulator
MLELRSLPTDCAARRRETACTECGARALSVCGSLEADDLGRLDALAERLTLTAGQPIVRQGDVARHVYNITSGSVRVYKLLADGRRQITGFLFAGDFLGLATGETYAFSAEALEPATACRFSKTGYLMLSREAPALEATLLARASHELAAAHDQMLLLGRKTARERVASFLMDLSVRDPARAGLAGQVRLPMTRLEIADYLGLTIETISRTLSRLKAMGVIAQASLNELWIEQPQTLRAIADGEA